MKIETKIKYKGEPVIITGIALCEHPYITVPLAIQARITYANGDTGWVSFDKLKSLDFSEDMKIKKWKKKI